MMTAAGNEFQAENGYNAGMVNCFRMRRMTVWIACFAMLLNALAPSLSYAMSARSSLSGSAPFLIEVCSANGTKQIAAPAQKTADARPESTGEQKKSLAASGHCPFCLPQDGPHFLPSAGAIRIGLPAQQGRMPTLFYQSPQPLFSWAVAHPRDPPAAS